MSSKNLALADATTEFPYVGDDVTIHCATGEQSGIVIEVVRKHGHAAVWVQASETGTRWIYTLRTNGAWVDGMSGDDGPAVTFGQRAKFWDTSAL